MLCCGMETFNLDAGGAVVFCLVAFVTGMLCGVLLSMRNAAPHSP